MSLGALKRAVAWGVAASGTLALVRALGQRGTAVILLYHRVCAERDPLFHGLPVRDFEGQIAFVRAHYRVEPLMDVLRWLREGAPGPSRVAVTIDDGYPDTYVLAHPILRRHGVPSTLFLSTEPPETGRALWLDRLSAALKATPALDLHCPTVNVGPWSLGSINERVDVLGRLSRRLKKSGAQEVEDVVGTVTDALGAGAAKRPPVLTWDQVREMSAQGMDIGGHTHRHYILSRLSSAEAREEIATSMDLIKARVGRAAATFAYPNGRPEDFDAGSKSVLAEIGVEWACTVRDDFARPGDDRLEIPRLYGAAETVPLFGCRIGGLTRREAAAPS